jgi:MYXO-CTERM domain-containing protein
MPKCLLRLFAGAMFLACGLGLRAAPAPANPSFTISATNTTMSASGASIPFTVTSLNGYAGQLGFICGPTNPPAGARLPYCGGGPAFQITLTANSSVKSAIDLTAVAAPLSAASRLNFPGHGTEAAWAFAAVLLFGFGLRRRRARWLSILLLSAAALTGLMTLDACGGRPQPTLTPGTFAYTLTAWDTSTSATASTSVNVTVPAGIPATVDE